jgi:hypothetical protein
VDRLALLLYLLVGYYVSGRQTYYKPNTLHLLPMTVIASTTMQMFLFKLFLNLVSFELK